MPVVGVLPVRWADRDFIMGGGGRRGHGVRVWFFGFGFGFGFALRWHPRYVSVLQASPLCGAAPTFLCRRKEK
ncbi:hypothetical protein BCAR13_160001 [Paraburkholderia caribensis]|nr:hypothetical protein BCAR13_160001 [Paraburkholderia caribensis]